MVLSGMMLGWLQNERVCWLCPTWSAKTPSTVRQRSGKPLRPARRWRSLIQSGWGGFLGWLRTGVNMRSASLVGALKAARAMLVANAAGSRALVASVLRRGRPAGRGPGLLDIHYGRTAPKPVKRGIADAATRPYNEYALHKYDTASKATGSLTSRI